jgi:hypothetical protein
VALSLLQIVAWVVVVLVAPLGARAGSQPQDPTVTALIEAIRIHEDSVRSLHWRQTATQPLAGGVGDAVYRSEQMFDESGRWFASCEDQLYDGTRFTAVRRELRYDGRLLQTTDLTHARSVLDAYRGQRKSVWGVDCWLGWQLNTVRQTHLAEVLAEARDCELVDVHPNRNPTLAATARLDQLIAKIEVEVDPLHGYSPRRVTVRDRALGVAYFRYEVQEFVLVDSIWLPSVASFEARKIIANPKQDSALGVELARLGLSRDSDMMDPAVQKAFAQAVSAALGKPEVDSELLVAPVSIVFEYVSVNKMFESEQFEPRWTDEMGVFDHINNRIKAPGSAEWQENPG